MMQPDHKKTNRPGRPAPGKALTPAAVAEAAMRLIDSEGMAEFSMRRLGQSLGVEAMALYNHFEDKEAILDAVASLVLDRVPLAPVKGSWRSRIKALCFGIRGLARRHPNLFRLAMTRRAPPATGLPLTESVLTAFADAGLAPEAQAIAYHTCFLYVRGFCLWEIEEFGPAREREPAVTPVIAGKYPHTAAAIKWIVGPNLDIEFEAGLDTILRGVSVRSGRDR